MTNPVYTAEAFHKALMNLLPRGLVWPRDPNDPLSKTMRGISAIYARQAARSAYLLVDAFPLYTTELLPEWEKSVGLPSECSGLGASIQIRRNQMLARFIGRGSPTKQFFIDYAKTLGYDITITYGDASLQTPFLCGVDTCGEPLNGGGDAANPWVWFVHGAAANVEYFKTGVNVAGDPLVASSGSLLVCEMKRVRPAHTILKFDLT